MLTGTKTSGGPSIQWLSGVAELQADFRTDSALSILCELHAKPDFLLLEPFILQKVLGRRPVSRIQLHHSHDEVPILFEKFFIFRHREWQLQLIFIDVVDCHSKNPKPLFVRDFLVAQRDRSKAPHLFDEYPEAIIDVIWLNIFGFEDVPVVSEGDANELRDLVRESYKEHR